MKITEQVTQISTINRCMSTSTPSILDASLEMTLCSSGIGYFAEFTEAAVVPTTSTRQTQRKVCIKMKAVQRKAWFRVSIRKIRVSSTTPTIITFVLWDMNSCQRNKPRLKLSTQIS